MGQPIKRNKQELENKDIEILTLKEQENKVVKITDYQIHLNSDGTPDRRFKVNQEGESNRCYTGSNRTDHLTEKELSLVLEQYKKQIIEAKTISKQWDARRNLCMFVCAIVVGFRATDFLDYKYKDIFDANWNYQTNFTKRISKNGAPVPVDYTNDFRNAMDDFLILQKEQGLTPKLEDYVFISHKQINNPEVSGMSRVQWWRICTKMIKAAGINRSIGTHGNRKTGVIRLLESNLDDYDEAIYYSSVFLGHENRKSTEHYVGIRDRRLKEMREKIPSIY